MPFTEDSKSLSHLLLSTLLWGNADWLPQAVQVMQVRELNQQELAGPGAIERRFSSRASGSF